jgi:hypothetical protein
MQSEVRMLAAVFVVSLYSFFVVLGVTFDALTFWWVRRRYPERYREIGSPPLLPVLGSERVRRRARRALRQMLSSDLSTDRTLVWFVRTVVAAKWLGLVCFVAVVILILPDLFPSR